VHLLLGVLPIIVRLSRLILSLLFLSLDKQCKQLLDICQDNCLEQVVNEETHFTEKSKSILDLFFTSNSSLINKVEVIPGISDHDIVLVYFSWWFVYFSWFDTCFNMHNVMV
jgi:hypothetical protein